MSTSRRLTRTLLLLALLPLVYATTAPVKKPEAPLVASIGIRSLSVER